MRSNLCFFSLCLLAGCLSIDTAPLENQRAYHTTKSSLARIVPLEGTPLPFLAGAARVDITPPIGTPLAGYGSRKGRGATGVHDRIYTRALAIGNGDQTVMIIANDLLAITNEMRQAVYTEISQHIPISPEALMISASHTHSGSGGIGRKRLETLATGPYDPQVFRETAHRMAMAAKSAYQKMSPAQMAFARVSAPGFIRNRMIKNGPTDPALDTFLFTTANQTIYLVNFSAHPTILNARNFLVSGDFPGVIEEKLERGANVIALYTAGSVGDMGPRPPIEGEAFSKAQAMGDALADRALLAVREIPYQGRMIIGYRLAEVHLPPPQIKIGKRQRLASPLGRLLLDSKTILQAIRLGDLLLVGIPGDLSSEIGIEIKQHAESLGLHAVIIGFANDYIGYIIPNRYYTLGFYESFMSFNGPHMDRYIKEVSFTLMESLVHGGVK